MKHIKNLFPIMVFLIVVGLVLGACTPLSPASPDTPVQQDPNNMEPIGETPAPNEVAQKAAETLAKQMGITPGVVKVISVEQVQWPDACLGAAQPGEMCAEVITPGYRVAVEVNGKQYFLHTNINGDQVKVVESLPGSMPGGQGSNVQEPAAVVAAMQALAAHLGVAVDQVKVLKFESVEWPDGCLGLAGPEEMCTMAIVPGLRVTLAVGEQEYVVRTDAGGSQVRIDLPVVGSGGGSVPLPAADAVIITYKRTGGIAGFCDEMQVMANGQVLTKTCADHESAYSLTVLQHARLADWITRYASFSYQVTDPASADAMTIELVFSGLGSQQPDHAQQEEIVNFASEVLKQR